MVEINSNVDYMLCNNNGVIAIYKATKAIMGPGFKSEFIVKFPEQELKAIAHAIYNDDNNDS